MQCAARSSGRVRLNDPRNDFANGVRELATITASLITIILPKLPSTEIAGFEEGFGEGRPRTELAGLRARSCEVYPERRGWTRSVHIERGSVRGGFRWT